MLLHASAESGICARKAWGSRLQKARTPTNVCFHLLSSPVPSNFEGPSWQVSLAKHDTASREKITKAVMFIKTVHETACKETWSIATPLIAADYSGHTGFFRQESVLLLAMFRNRKWLFLDLPISVQKSKNIALHAVPAERRNKTLECWLATLNVSSAIMSHALEQIDHWNKLELTYLPPARAKVRTSSAPNVMHLEPIWAVECLLLGFHAQKKQCFVLDSWWITNVTTEFLSCTVFWSKKKRWNADCFLDFCNVLYKVRLRLKASESSQRCKGRALNFPKRKKRPVVPCHLQ